MKEFESLNFWLTLVEDISNIEYNYVYTHHSNQMYMIKSNGGSGTVEGLAFNNFMGHSNAYTLDFDTAWSSMSVTDGDGISYTNISFSGWTGTCESGMERGPVKIDCPEAVACNDITVEDFNVWTDDGGSEVLYVCQNAYGTGACLVDGSADTAYTTTQTVSSVGDYTYTTMDNELSTGYDISASIPIPTMPASFYPGRLPLSAVLNGAASAASATGSGSSAASTSGAASSGSKYVSSAALPAYVASTSSSASSAVQTSASDAQPSAGGHGAWGASSGFGSGFVAWAKGDVAEPATTPAPESKFRQKRSAKFRRA